MIFFLSSELGNLLTMCYLYMQRGNILKPIEKKPRKGFLFSWVIGVILGCSGAIYGISPVYAGEQKTFVGSKACGECHEEAYKNYSTYAKKAHSFEHIMKMKRNLTPEEFKGCLKCHTTGYGEPGGFVSVSKTPQLKDVGCEACHGPGSIHVKTENPKDIIGKLDIKACGKCHTRERVEAFRFKPLIHGGAH